tara:strand:- start:54 stop:221 length:168 start_codon:yes stop_codon:yes gene_type:complete
MSLPAHPSRSRVVVPPDLSGRWLPIHLFGGAPGHLLFYFLLHTGLGGLWLGATTL